MTTATLTIEATRESTMPLLLVGAPRKIGCPIENLTRPATACNLRYVSAVGQSANNASSRSGELACGLGTGIRSELDEARPTQPEGINSGYPLDKHLPTHCHQLPQDCHDLPATDSFCHFLRTGLQPQTTAMWLGDGPANPSETLSLRWPTDHQSSRNGFAFPQPPTSRHRFTFTRLTDPTTLMRTCRRVDECGA